jgi:spermidine/putrescine transport system substrate-binding protein
MGKSREDRDLLRDPVTRRQVVQAGAGLALTAALAGCGVGGGVTGGDTTRDITPKVDGDLVYFNWAQYLDPGLFKKFEQSTGSRGGSPTSTRCPR